MKNKDFYKSMRLQEQEKRSAGNESTADLYRAVRNHFKDFCGGSELPLKEMTAERVHGFTEWLRAKGLQVNSVNSYLSNLRAMYNRACLDWKGRPQESPFARLRLKQEETRKRAAPFKVIEQLASLDLTEEPEKQQAAGIALFPFMACGIPFVDLVHLTRENLSENGKVLSYYRQKTGAFIQMEVSAGMKCLIEHYSSEDSKYLFPVLPENATHEQYKLCLAKQNQALKEICQCLDWDGELTTYVFRHTWASEAYHRHIPIAIISQALGHSSEQMTRRYLAAFGIEELAEANKQVSGKIEMLVV